MAKNHTYEMMSVYIGDKMQTIKNQYFRVRCRVGFTVKHDGDAVSTDHSATFDLSMLWTVAMEILLKQIVVYLQNKTLRAMRPDAAKKWLREHDPVKYDDVFTTTKRTVVVKQMTDDDVKEKAKNDPEYRAKMIAEFMAMENQG